MNQKSLFEQWRENHLCQIAVSPEILKLIAEAFQCGRLYEMKPKQEQGEPVALKVYRGELCYKSQTDDQSFGMWCPVTQDLPFPEGTKFYITPQPAQKQEQGEPDKYVMDIECTKCGAKQSGILTVNTTPQPKQEQGEPVYQLGGDDGKWLDQTKKQFEYNSKHGWPTRILYTTPQPAQKPWVGLTDEEQHECIFDRQGFVLNYEDVVDAVEAKLKEKNT